MQLSVCLVFNQRQLTQTHVTGTHIWDRMGHRKGENFQKRKTLQSDTAKCAEVSSFFFSFF